MIARVKFVLFFWRSSLFQFETPFSFLGSARGYCLIFPVLTISNAVIELFLILLEFECSDHFCFTKVFALHFLIQRRYDLDMVWRLQLPFLICVKR